MEFKNYKEKQAYYKNLAKQEKVFFNSGISSRDRTKEGQDKKRRYGSIIKGRTYVKPKEEK